MAPSAAASGAIATIAHISNNTNSSWWRDAGLRRLNTWILFIYLSSAAGGYDGSLISGLYSIPRWLDDIGNPDTQRQSLLIASAFIGGVAAFCVAPWLPDYWGRKKAMAFGDVIVLAGALGQTFVNSSWGYIGTRFLMGMGGVISATAAPALAIELAHPRQFDNCFFYAGAILAAWISFGTLNIASSWSWRLPTMFQAIPSVVQLAALPFIPESPRWLFRNGRGEEAKAILLKYHANGAAQDDLVDFEVTEIMEQMQEDERTGDEGWSMFIKTAGMRKRLAICILCGFYSQWAGNGIISYNFSQNSIGVTSHTQTSGLYGGLAIWNACFAIWGASNVDRFGRRTLWLASGGVMLVSYVLVTALSATYAKTKDVRVGYAVIVFLFTFFAGYDIALTPLLVGYPSEILPNKARAKGLGITFLTCYVALVFNTYANPLALAAISWKYYFVYIAVIAIMIVVIYVYFPETRGKTLEEIAEIFDGPLPSHGSASPEMDKVDGVKGDLEYVEKL
ncbi:hypothetical protein RQP46_007263 [Phenoliferia psychrophenolica]